MIPVIIAHARFQSIAPEKQLHGDLCLVIIAQLFVVSIFLV